jgi:hypothetical protein
MKRVQCVSLPRSGHHLLVDILADYIGDEFVYADSYGVRDVHGNKTAIAGLPRTLSTCPEANYEKTHDFDLDVDLYPADNRVFIVQYREPVAAIVSHYLFGTNGEPGDRKTWEEFARIRAVYFHKFKEKWIDGSEYINLPVTKVPYERLVTMPVFSVSEILDFMGCEVDEKKVRECCTKHPIKLTHAADNFAHYDYGFYREIEQTMDTTW